LNGKWQANASNELNFLVQSDRQEDVLTFKGAWKLNRNQEITYTYEKQDLRRKSRAREELTFQGFWQINSRDNISYILDLDQGSLFEFKVQLQQPDLKGDRRQIKYRIGIGGKGFRRERVFSLFGSWRVESSKNIFFQVDCAETGVKALTFAADVFLNNNNQLVFELKNRQGKPLGITVSFERAFLKKRAALFARLSKARSIHSLEAGVKIPW